MLECSSDHWMKESMAYRYWASSVSDAQKVLIFILATLCLHCAPAHEGSREFCIDILQQSNSDYAKCRRKPQLYQIENASQDVLILFCCLGYFHDVRLNYMSRIDPDLLMVFKKTDKDTQFDIGSYVKMCSEQPGDELTFSDFSQWRNGHDDDSDTDSNNSRRCPD